MVKRIEDYALIGDCETAALVGRDGSIDWLCWPRFDSGACFAALLGTPENGRWKIAPDCPVTGVQRRYRDGTLILETDFETPEGAITLIDFMPIRDVGSDLVRIVVGRRGVVPIAMELVLRFDYGRLIPWVFRVDQDCLRAVVGPHSAFLRTSVHHEGKDLRTLASFKVREGDRVPFALTYQASHLPTPPAVDAEKSVCKTEEFWREWVGGCDYRGPWSEAVTRSLVTIKAMTYRPTGGIVAAPTTSLPERHAGCRNWDYRYCWLRDAAFMVACLLKAGYRDEAKDWLAWLLRAVAGSPSQVQPIYGIAGEHRINEWTADWLKGFEGANPVRIGNAAFAQHQLDVFGEVMNAAHIARRSRLRQSDAAWNLQKALLQHVEAIWDKPDDGIWETRGGSQQFVHSKVMAWVAVDRAIKAVEEFDLQGPVQRWRALRSKIHSEICARGYDRARGSFVQAFGSPYLDASVLLIPIVGFLPASDPRMKSTVAAVERELMNDGFVLRYDSRKTKDGLPPGEGSFLVCSFWLAHVYALQGRQKQAEDLFERLLALRNDVGLLAEEYDPTNRTFLGNFPQALSHLALVNTAHQIAHGEVEPRASLGP